MTLELEREEVVQALCAHYAQDHLSTGELEARFERVYKSASTHQLHTVLEGLPAIGAFVRAPGPLYGVAPAGSGLPATEKRYVAIFASVSKEGAWLPAERITAKALFGSVLLDLREAAIPAGGIEIDIDVMFGDVSVLLPPGIGADVDCTALLGSVEDRTKRAFPGAPMIRARGRVVLGSLSVVTKLPRPARMESWRKQLKTFFGADDHDDSGLVR